MVRFSCFPGHTHYHKPKKVVQHSLKENCSQEMHKGSLEISPNGTLDAIPVSTPSILEDNSIYLGANTEQIIGTSHIECCWRSEELNAMSYSSDGNEVDRSISLKKSQSLGCGLDREGRFSPGEKTDDETDHGLPSGDLKDMRGVDNTFKNSGTAEICGCHDLGIDLLNQNQENNLERNADSLFNESFFSIEDIKQLDNDFYEYHGGDLPSDDLVELDHIHASPTLSKSCSLPKLGMYRCSPACRTLGHRSRSVGNLCDTDLRTGLSHGHVEGNSGEQFHQYRDGSSLCDISQAYDVLDEILHCETDFGEQCITFDTSKEYVEMAEKEKDLMTRNGDHDHANEFNDENPPQDIITSVRDWRDPETDSTGYGNIQGESTAESRDKMYSGDFNMKRITEWISQIDIDNSTIQEVGEGSNDISNMENDSYMTSGAKTSKPYIKGGDGVKAAYNYISSLTPASTSAQMANLGLVAIPFLSAFSNLRVLNLSGNAIIRITSGALPRGLHTLNLSRNNILVIEGLRELTRLRVLDISYNRICKIGHGLAACSSLKEVYLAGNKISEVEGLHRLLKLSILDLQFNKISTVKSLGQLAANYGSLQAINLEGNPIQRNVGDDQLKKYLHGLLPRLVYFNKHIIRSSLTKEAYDRPRSANSHQYDRSTRSDNKRSRRGHTTTSSHKITSPSNHLRVNQAMGSLPRLPRHRGQQPDLPTPEPKAHHHPPRTGRKLFSSLQAINPMRRSRSEGNL
ncbi:hypothetical protein Taro_030484 [Colocasia esculenta]|uniref:Uncharacterized protein n=1 Tax=Colocasia esculenta TaxID=4460 RepID=A0A843VGF7_COLES|nr:hypothetical protein [Colocasia esculenta]